MIYLILTILLFAAYIYTEMNETEEDSTNEEVVMVAIGIYTITQGLIFGATSVMINRNLKLNFM